ncbi:DUF4270 family protein [Hymenobacter lucidus]|uniref:DUF4270 domain-containing protein n=1 Tax=Hymenobacter lucidus TaxID=2880930 RepID=A0ABS8AX82_9BACT|nr:DUF4270 family protein [Hymenobacter lucidus]MCB2410425.1 DUF4270 domain-containing protein [Hymenobacter lucidus]
MNWPISSAFRIASVSLVSTALLLATTSCEDPNDLGVELPGTSPINTEYRDYPVEAATILQDSVETLNADRALVGRVTDNVLGTTTAKVLYNLRTSPDSLPHQFTNAKLDSVVVVSAFDQVYGSSAQPVHFDLLPLAEPLNEKKTYNAGVADVALGSAIGTNLISSLNRTKKEERANGLKKLIKNADGNKVPGTVDSTTTVTVPDPTIRLVLHKDQVRNSELATRLFGALNDASFTQAKLDEIIKGLAIAPAAGYSSAVLGINRSVDNRIFVYFHSTKTGRTQPYVPQPYTIRLGTSYASSDPNAPRYYSQISTALKAPFDVLANGTQSVRTTDNLAYMQEGVGLAAKLTFTGLDALRDQSALAINRAELIIPVKSSGGALFPNPTQAFLYELNAQNRVLLRTVNISPVERIVQANLQNQLGQGNEAVVTLYNLSPTNKYYSVVITTYLQAYLANQLGEQAASLMLSPVLRRSFGLSLNRSVLDAQKIKLRVYSSKLR